MTQVYFPADLTLSSIFRRSSGIIQKQLYMSIREFGPVYNGYFIG